jgi:hypothetical protein
VIPEQAIELSEPEDLCRRCFKEPPFDRWTE